MKVTRLLPVSVVILLLSVFILPVIAAECPDIVKSALDATDTACTAVGRNQACYGNINLTVEAQATNTTFNFTKPGDLVEISGVKKLILSPLDANADTWGIALLKVQANLPDTLPGQNVSFVLFGDVQIDNAVTTAATLSVTAQQLFNVRAEPSSSAAVVSPLQGGTELLADGITDDAAWLRVHTADASVQGWVSASIVTITGDVSTLAIVKADAPRYSPMQAFYFQSGLSDAPCSQAPDSGILIQTPQGAGKIALNVDGADITLGSTAYFQAQPSGEMTVSVVEGQGTVTSGGQTVVVPAGTRVRVPLDANLTANGAPIGPEPYEDARLAVLPITLLTDAITLTPALTVDAIASAAIQISPGKWTSAADVVNSAAACGFASGQTTGQTTFANIESPYDLAQIISLSGQRVPLSELNPTHQGNTYTVDYADGTIQTHMEVKVLSPTSMQRDSVTTSIATEGCVTTVSGTFEHVGG